LRSRDLKGFPFVYLWTNGKRRTERQEAEIVAKVSEPKRLNTLTGDEVPAVPKPEEPRGLTPKERGELDRYEEVIQRGLQTFVEVGRALSEVRDLKLYREFGTFERYLKERWGFSARHGRRLMGSARVVANISNRGSGPNGPLPINEGQARSLAALPAPEQQQEAWALAQEKAADPARVTGRIVQQAVDEVKRKAAPAGDVPTSMPADEAADDSLEEILGAEALWHRLQDVADFSEGTAKWLAYINAYRGSEDPEHVVAAYGGLQEIRAGYEAETTPGGSVRGERWLALRLANRATGQ
jgi:hypothetical protein